MVALFFISKTRAARIKVKLKLNFLVKNDQTFRLIQIGHILKIFILDGPHIMTT